MAKLAPGIVADGVANRLSERVRRLGPFLALSKQRHSLGREGSIPRASSPAFEKVTFAIFYPTSSSALTSTEIVSTVRRFMPTVSSFESGQSAIAVRSSSSFTRIPSGSPSSRSA